MTSRRPARELKILDNAIVAQIQPADEISATPAEFLNALYGQDPPGYRVIWTAPDKVSRWLDARETPEAINVSQKLTNTFNVYFGVGLQGQKLGRKQRGGNDTVIAIPGLWLDLDCQGGVHAATNLPTFEEATKFLNEFPLPPSIIVHSGGGLYPFWLFPELWVFKDKADHDRATNILNRFKNAFVALAASKGWKLDSTSDLARVLRLPGMLNRKYNPPPTVKILKFHPERRYTFDEITKAIETLAAKVPKKSKATTKQQEAGADTGPADTNAIFERCTFIHHCQDDAATLPEPEWYAMLTVIARAKDGEKLCHELSSPHPHYSERETDEKIRHALADTGPYTCERIRADFCQCADCKEKVTSPLVLGRPKTAPADELLEKAKLLQDSPYALHGFTTCFQKERHTQGGGTEVITERLCNFVAWQEEKRTLDDGSGETRQMFLMHGRTHDGRWLPEIEIPATNFANMQWVGANWSPKAIMAAGGPVRDREREAIELLSQGLRERHIYMHTGMRQIEGDKWCFLHADGAIGCDNGIEVQLPKELSGYSLPAAAGDVRDAIQSSLRFLDVGKPDVTYPLWASMYRAPTSEFLYPGFTLFLLGITGLFKSTMAALALSHFGDFTTDTLPTGWTSTDNSLEKISFYAKDVPLVVDDYAPERDSNQSKAMERKANRLLRTTANRTGRGRLRSDLTVAPSYIPRCLTIVTGEQLPDSMQSILARCLAVKFEAGSVDKDRLTAAQAEAGLYAQAMRGFIEWLLPRAEHLPDELKQGFLKYRNKAESGLSRLAETAAHLQLGFVLGLDFALDSGVITRNEMQERARASWDVFTRLALEQEQIIKQERPALLFVRGLQSLFIQGAAHLRGRSNDGEPSEPREWGWQEVSSITGCWSYIPGGDPLGWVDDEAIYLLPEASFKAVAEFYRISGGFPINQRSLRDHLIEAGLAEREDGHRTMTTRVAGNVKRVLKLSIQKYFDSLL